MKSLAGATAAAIVAFALFPVAEWLAHDAPATGGDATTAESRVVGDHRSSGGNVSPASKGPTGSCSRAGGDSTSGSTGSGSTPSCATAGTEKPSDGSTGATHLPNWTSGALALVGGEVNGLSFSVTPPLTLAQWSSSYLSYIGVGRVAATDPRVRFLERWAEVEGVYDHGNQYNPLDTKYGIVGDRSFNKYGVKAYPSLTIGYQATLATMEQRFDHPILAALRNPRSSSSSLARALAESDWVGFGGGSWAEQYYAAEIARVPMASFDLPLPSVSFQGRLVDPRGQGLADVCVSALSSTAPAKGVVTSANGNFTLLNLPRAEYRLQILDCHHVAGSPVPVYYSSKSSPSFTTSLVSHATMFSTRCVGIAACPSQHVNLNRPAVFGVLSPSLTWNHPPSISYGTALSAAQLDARSPVPGTFTYSPARGAVLGPGSHAIRVIFRPKDRRDYSPKTSTTALQVSRALPLISWPAPVEIAEGTPLSATQLDATSPVPGSFTYSPSAGTQLGVGAHVLTVRFQPKDRDGYRAVVKTVVLVVTAADSAAS